MKIQHAFYQSHRAMPIGGYIWRASGKKYWRHVVILLGVLVGVMLTAPIAFAQPANDEIANATEITTLPFSEGLDTRDATADAADGGCGGSSDLATVWYTFTPDADMIVKVDTSGSSYSTGVNVFSGTPGNLALISCSFTSVTFSAVAGTQYFFMIAACCDDVNGGDLVFSVLDLGPPLHITLHLNTTAAGNTTTGTATVSGTVTCNNPAGVDVSGQLRQKLGRRIIAGGFSAHLSCDGETPWSAIVRSDQGAFGGGSAELLGFAGGCDQFTCDDDQATTIVRLRGKKDMLRQRMLGPYAE